MPKGTEAPPEIGTRRGHRWRLQEMEGRPLSLTSCWSPVLSTVRRLKLEELEFEASLGHIGKHCHKRQKKSVSHTRDALLSTEGRQGQMDLDLLQFLSSLSLRSLRPGPSSAMWLLLAFVLLVSAGEGHQSQVLV